MQNTQLESYLKRLETGLKAISPAEREAQLREMRGHLETLIASYITQGQTRDEATRLAIQQFGAPNELSRDLNHVALRQTLGSNAPRFVKGFSAWICWVGFNFLFFASMNDKPTDFPFLLKDQLLWSAILATFGFVFGLNVLKKWKSRRVMS